MNITIKQAQLEELADHLREGGSEELAVLAKIIGVRSNNSGTVNAYLAELRAANPDEFGLLSDVGLEDAPAPAKAEVPVPAEPVAKKYLVQNPDGTISELELVKETSKAIVLVAVVPKDIVSVVLGGKMVELDLVELRSLPGNAERHGRPVAALIQLAELSKG